MPISAMFRRPIFSRSKQRFRFNPEEVEKIKSNHEMILMIEINRRSIMKQVPIEYQVSIYGIFNYYYTDGVGMLGFERISAKLVGNDAWISTLLLEYLLIL